MDNQQVISTINEVIETCKDGEMGFCACAENVEGGEINCMLTERAQRCAEAASELQNEVRRLGGDPDTHGSISGTLHRGWLNVKAVITGKDEAACWPNASVARILPCGDTKTLWLRTYPVTFAP